MATPTRIEDDLYESAKAAGTVMSRSAAQQINHWARLGRQLEAMPNLDLRHVHAVLTGQESYDALDGNQQAVVRTEWDRGIAQAREELDLTAVFAARGITDWVEADPDGATVVRHADER